MNRDGLAIFGVPPACIGRLWPALSAAAAVTGHTEEQILKHRGSRGQALARALAIRVIRERWEMSPAELARMFCRDRTTILSAERNLDRILAQAARGVPSATAVAHNLKCVRLGYARAFPPEVAELGA